jgi:uncharacterized protein YciI
MHIILLKFGPNRSNAGQWMAEHARWIQQGINDGVFLMAGSLDNAQGGAVLAVNLDSAQVQHRVAQDPFVVHEVVTPEIHTVTPSRMSHGLAALVDHAKTSSVAS